MINIGAAKNHFSQLVARAIAGEDVVIARNGRPVARLVRYAEPATARRLGLLKGRVRMARDFDAPLPEEVLRHFEANRSLDPTK